MSIFLAASDWTSRLSELRAGRETVACAEFSREGHDRNDPACGRGWVTTGDEHPQHVFAALAAMVQRENRCLVPANSFAEYARSRTDNKKTDVVWFGLLRRFPAPIGWARLRPGFVELGLKVKK